MGDRGARLGRGSVSQEESVSEVTEEGAPASGFSSVGRGTRGGFRAVSTGPELLPGGLFHVWQQLWDGWRRERGELGSKLGTLSVVQIRAIKS